MRRSTGMLLGLAAALGAGCLSDGRGGTVGAVDVPDGVSLDGTDTGGDDTTVADTAVADTTAADTAVADTAAADTSVGPDTMVGVCGDGVRGPNEACDDGNACPIDGCNAGCATVPSVVLASLALDPAVAFDLDDADGDHDVATGGDNRLGQNSLVASVVNPLIAQSIDDADVIQLVTFDDLGNAYADPVVDLVLHPGVAPACPVPTPVPWTHPGGAFPELFSDARAWPSCAAPLRLEGAIAPSRPSSASPEPPVLVADSSSPVVIPAGSLGNLTVARSHLEAHVVAASGVVDVLALSDGRLSGVIPASALYRIDTSSLLPGCPTALHAVLALVGHIDQDTEGNGKRDWIQFTLGGGQPCLGSPVTIVGCCNDGDCDDFVPGEACALDPRIGDGYSAGFRFEAVGVRVVGQVDGGSWCSP